METEPRRRRTSQRRFERRRKTWTGRRSEHKGGRGNAKREPEEDRRRSPRGPRRSAPQATHRLPRPDPPEEASRAVAQVALAGIAWPLALAAALRHGLRVPPAEGVDGVAGDVPELQAGVAPLGALRRVKPGRGEARSRARQAARGRDSREAEKGWL